MSPQNWFKKIKLFRKDENFWKKSIYIPENQIYGRIRLKNFFFLRFSHICLHSYLNYTYLPKTMKISLKKKCEFVSHLWITFAHIWITYAKRAKRIHIFFQKNEFQISRTRFTYVINPLAKHLLESSTLSLLFVSNSYLLFQVYSLWWNL